MVVISVPSMLMTSTDIVVITGLADRDCDLFIPSVKGRTQSSAASNTSCCKRLRSFPPYRDSTCPNSTRYSAGVERATRVDEYLSACGRTCADHHDAGCALCDELPDFRHLIFVECKELPEDCISFRTVACNSIPNEVMPRCSGAVAKMNRVPQYLSE